MSLVLGNHAEILESCGVCNLLSNDYILRHTKREERGETAKMSITESRYWGVHCIFPSISKRLTFFIIKFKKSVPVLRGMIKTHLRWNYIWIQISPLSLTSCVA